uniref:Uncharacterized protein n=1 Tax=Romanomermis culicivorax TaxID=13658 RepID=A0A915HQ78_ROMCU
MDCSLLVWLRHLNNLRINEHILSSSRLMRISDECGNARISGPFLAKRKIGIITGDQCYIRPSRVNLVSCKQTTSESKLDSKFDKVLGKDLIPLTFH